MRIFLFQDIMSSIELDAIDFSSWLSNLVTSNQTQVHMKISMPGAEVALFEKMIIDGTLTLINKLDIEWSDRTKPALRAKRIYVQSMLDALGYNYLYLTRLPDVQQIFRTNKTFDQVKKYPDWKIIPESDTFSHYCQRPVVFDPPRTTNKRSV
jgi:hypothetical protein